MPSEAKRAQISPSRSMRFFRLLVGFRRALFVEENRVTHERIMGARGASSLRWAFDVAIVALNSSSTLLPQFAIVEPKLLILIPSRSRVSHAASIGAIVQIMDVDAIDAPGFDAGPAQLFYRRYLPREALRRLVGESAEIHQGFFTFAGPFFSALS